MNVEVKCENATIKLLDDERIYREALLPALEQARPQMLIGKRLVAFAWVPPKSASPKVNLRVLMGSSRIGSSRPILLPWA